MKGDFSRLTFDPKKNYGNVRMQQGRVQLDADWNEQVDLTEHRIGTLFEDLIGLSGVPQGAGTAVPSDFQLQVASGAIQLQPGHMYVAGMLVENPAAVSLTAQPNLPAAALPTTDGRYLAYLDVWQRLVTALEDPEIRDPALGGADTTVRTKNVWQVKLALIDPADDVLGNSDAILDQKAPARLSTGRMNARLQRATTTLDNRLYRVEVHDGGALGSATTFKWSQDNGAIAARVTQIHTATVNTKQVTTITLSDAETAVQSRFAPNQWIEFSNEALTLNGLPGIFAKLTAVGERSLTIESWASLTPEQTAVCGLNWQQDLGSQPMVRRWDSPGAPKLEKPTANEGWLALEKGIEVKFEAGNYKTGDFWLIPTRHLTGQIDWPAAGPQPPHGIQHHYAPLTALTLAGGTWTLQEDLRRLFSALTGGLLSKQGDIMTGSLRVSADLHVDNNVGIGTTDPKAKLAVVGTASISDGSDYATTNSKMATGSLTIGSITQDYGGGQNWNSNTAGLLLETLNNTEIAVHDAAKRLASFMFYEGDDTNRFTIGRDMGFGAISEIVLNGNIGIGTTSPSAKLEIGSTLTATQNGETLVALKIAPTFNENSKTSVKKVGLIVADGNVGIGTTSPGAPLEIGSTLTATANNQSLVALKIAPTFNENSKTSVKKVGLIVADGYVGIGTTSPGARLEVSGNAIVSGDLTIDTNTLHVDSTTNRVGIGTTSPGAPLEIGSTLTATANNQSLVALKIAPTFNENSKTNVKKVGLIVADGNVGIGTTAPGEKLEIKATGGDNVKTEFLSIYNDGGGASQESRIIWKNGAGRKDAAAIASRPGGGYDAGDLRFQTAKNGTLNEQMIIDSSGNVGIGTTSPSANLDISGLPDKTGQVSLQLRSGNTSDNFASNQMTFGYNNTATIRHAIKTRHHGSSRSGNAIDFYVWKYLSSSDHDAAADIGSLHTMTLDGGNVGIGTTNPGAKLEVNGPFMEKMDVIACGGRDDWANQDHPIKIYFKTHLSGKPAGTMLRATQDYSSWRGHYWIGWVDADSVIRVAHNGQGKTPQTVI